jgi:hypothetical protein
MMKRIITVVLGVCFVAVGIALPLPKNLIAFNSAAGLALLSQSHHKTDFAALVSDFTTQRGLSWCAVASDVMALNALPIAPPLTPEHAPYRIFEQGNFFNAASLSVIVPAYVYAKGVTLAQDAKLLRAHHAKVQLVYGSSVSVAQFKKAAMSAVSSKKKIILVNFCRKYIHEKGCGHFSPLAAYNKASDRFLLLDVARYKYPPVWVSTAALYKAVSTGVDSTSKKSRGYLLVSAQ